MGGAGVRLWRTRRGTRSRGPNSIGIRATRDESKREALLRLIRRARNTSFGRSHRFSEIDSIRAFRERVNIHAYADLKPWFERALEGESDVTWPGRIRYFGMSSGTTAGNKYLPISMDSVRQQQRGGFDPVAAYLRWSREPSVMGGKYLMLGGSSRLEPHESGALIGDNTGVMANHMPLVVRNKYLPSGPVRGISDWDEKIRAAAEEAVDHDVRVVAGTPSWFPGLFDEVLDAATRRGRQPQSIYDVWPNLKLITGGGIGYEAYRPLIEARLGDRVPYVDVYNATEGGIMGVQDRLDEPTMRLLPDNGLFYEFIPVEEVDKPEPTRLSLWEVERDQVYALAVSTMSGIWAYTIGDCLRFTETRPHRFVFEGRTAAFLNVTGEHVSQGELERAVRVAATQLGVTVAEFSVGADVGVDGSGAARHIYFLEVEGSPPSAHRFAALVDEDVASLNDDYAAHRSGRGLQLPSVRLVPRGTFHRFMKARGKLGGQNKVPRVVAGDKRTLLETLAIRHAGPGALASPPS